MSFLTSSLPKKKASLTLLAMTTAKTKTIQASVPTSAPKETGAGVPKDTGSASRSRHAAWPNPRAAGVIGIRLVHTLTPNGPSVHVLRALELSPRGPVRLAMPLVVRTFRVENERMMRTLKAYAEANRPEALN